MFFRRARRSQPNCSRRRARAWGIEQLELRRLLAATPFGASPEDTGEFLLGDVYVTVVAFESDGSRDVSTEDWNDDYRNDVKARVASGLEWWETTLAGVTDKHELNFEVDYTYLDAPIATGYEPIARPSFDFQLWMYDFLRDVGYDQSGNFSSDIRAFNHAQREAHDAHWAFTIFVVNDEMDSDGRFEPGSFDRAFAYAGGRFFVTPAGRPDSTIAHETGHMFWARDEYAGGGTFDSFRGYYNTQNWNAWNNPAFSSPADREPSIMDRGACEEGGGLLCDAFTAHTSSTSSLEMLGWRDSDGDGVFDVLDVPHTLTGTGTYDATTGSYRFTGESSVQTLPNLNSSGTQNDMTIAQVSRAEFRIDGGAWQLAETYNEYVAELDLTIPMSPGSTIEIRTIDAITGITSPVFQGGTDRPASTLVPGINGLVWNDLDADGQRTATETGLAGWTVQLVDPTGEPLELGLSLEPDDYPTSSMLLNSVLPTATLSSVGFGVSDNSVFSAARSPAPTGDRVFASFSASCGGTCTDWTAESRQLRIDFDSPVTSVRIDALGVLAGDQARLEVYDASDQLLARYTSRELAAGAVETMTLNRDSGDIAYAIASAHADGTVRLDNLRFGAASSVVTSEDGFYAFGYVPAGDYELRVVAMPGWVATSPTAGNQFTNVVAGQAVDEIDFGLGLTGTTNQNPENRFDVNNDGFATPIDALVLINDLNANGNREISGESPPPFRDVNGDGFLTPNDVLQVINHLNGVADGEAEGLPAAGTGYLPTNLPRPNESHDSALAATGGTASGDRELDGEQAIRSARQDHTLPARLGSDDHRDASGDDSLAASWDLSVSIERRHTSELDADLLDLLAASAARHA